VLQYTNEYNKLQPWPENIVRNRIVLSEQLQQILVEKGPTILVYNHQSVTKHIIKIKWMLQQKHD